MAPCDSNNNQKTEEEEAKIAARLSAQDAQLATLSAELVSAQQRAQYLTSLLDQHDAEFEAVHSVWMQQEHDLQQQIAQWQATTSSHQAEIAALQAKLIAAEDIAKTATMSERPSPLLPRSDEISSTPTMASIGPATSTAAAAAAATAAAAELAGLRQELHLSEAGQQRLLTEVRACEAQRDTYATKFSR